MRKLVYHIASTLDGFIAKPDGSTPGFPMQGPHVDDYFAQLRGYDTVLMGRQTYAMGFPAGLVPGQPAYPGMRNIVVSASLQPVPNPPQGGPFRQMWLQMLGYEPGFEPSDSFELVRKDVVGFVRDLKAETEGGDIYLCGGGQLAGQLLSAGLLDELLLKLNPVIYGEGIRLFGDYTGVVASELSEKKLYDNGVALLRYRLLPA